MLLTGLQPTFRIVKEAGDIHRCLKLGNLLFYRCDLLLNRLSLLFTGLILTLATFLFFTAGSSSGKGQGARVKERPFPCLTLTDILEYGRIQKTCGMAEKLRTDTKCLQAYAGFSF